MIAANDPFEAANDNPPQPALRTRWQHIHLVGQKPALVVDVDMSALLEWYKQRGLV